MSTEAAKASLGKAQTKAPCVHHWVIEPPNGHLAPAVCRKCGAKATFRNSNRDLEPAGGTYWRKGAKWRGF
jgi:hypothetical protein